MFNFRIYKFIKLSTIFTNYKKFFFKFLYQEIKSKIWWYLSNFKSAPLFHCESFTSTKAYHLLHVNRPFRNQLSVAWRISLIKFSSHVWTLLLNCWRWRRSRKGCTVWKIGNLIKFTVLHPHLPRKSQSTLLKTILINLDYWWICAAVPFMHRVARQIRRSAFWSSSTSYRVSTSCFIANLIYGERVALNYTRNSLILRSHNFCFAQKVIFLFFFLFFV